MTEQNEEKIYQIPCLISMFPRDSAIPFLLQAIDNVYELGKRGYKLSDFRAPALEKEPTDPLDDRVLLTCLREVSKQEYDDYKNRQRYEWKALEIDIMDLIESSRDG